MMSYSFITRYLLYAINSTQPCLPGEERIAALAAHILTAAEVITVNLSLGPRTE